MPLYNFATYADVREEWAIEAESLAHARALIGDDPAGNWPETAFRLDADPVECRDEFVLDDDDEAPAIEEITPEHWAWRAAHREQIEHSLKQNIAAISVEFLTHRLFDAFYDRCGFLLDGSVGHYELCIAMAEALTEWEVSHGLSQAYEHATAPWIVVVEDFVEATLESALETGALPDPAKILSAIRVLGACSAMRINDWTETDAKASEREGWHLSICEGSSDGPVQIQKSDDLGILSTDQEAWKLIQQGSTSLHRKALEIIKSENLTEYQRIVSS